MNILSLRYSAPSVVDATPKASQVKLALEGSRAQVGVRGAIKDPELFRDVLLTAVAIRESDLRYKGKDRTAYLAYLMKQGKKATAAIWEAQKAFLEGAYADEAPKPRGLDPVLTVDPDEVSMEVFSRDESAYARVAFDNALFEDRAAAHGTTLADLSPAFVEQLERVRTYQPVKLEAATNLAGTPSPKDIELPTTYLRSFLQVQSAAVLPAASCEIAPIDLYNVLFCLRTRRAKKAPRALRFELVPGAKPRIVLEPWEIVLECHGPKFEGAVPRVIRTFGRQRLLTLARALPHVRGVRVHLLGPGLPAFWVLDFGSARMTIAFTSWSESSWGSVSSFDALMPRAEESVADRAAQALMKDGPQTLADLSKSLGKSVEDTRNALQQACLQGRVLFDLDKQKYRPRQLLKEKVDLGSIRFGSPREAAAHRLLEANGAKVAKLHVIAGEGTEVHGDVTDKTARRSFAPRFTVDTEGQAREAWCNCPTYQRSAMREGPCEHMMALYVHSRREQAEMERARMTPQGRKRIVAETRTFVRRDASGAQVTYRVSLDERVVRIEWAEAKPGEGLGAPRYSRMWFDTDAEARDAYFSRLDDLGTDGFIDASIA